MGSHLSILIKRAMKYSTSLKKKSMYQDKSWTMIDGDFEIQKLIFKSDGELLITKNGKVQTGAWEYIAGADSIVIDRKADKLLLNEVFLDPGVLILKLDGTVDSFYVFANQNVVPDLNVQEYLRKLSHVEFNIRVFRMAGGQELEVHNSFSNEMEGNFGKNVSIDGEEVPDGVYLLDTLPYAIIVEDSRISNYHKIKEIHREGGETILATCSHIWGIGDGDWIWINGKIPADGDYDLSKNLSVSVVNGKIVESRRKSWFKRLFG